MRAQDLGNHFPKAVCEINLEQLRTAFWGDEKLILRDALKTQVTPEPSV